MRTTQGDPYDRQRQREINELAGAVLIPGGFYFSPLVGGFQDSRSGLKFPGPRAVVNSETREITELIDLPSPIQLPTHRLAEIASLVESEQRKIRHDDARLPNEPNVLLCAFDAFTTDDFCGGLLLALRTGTIRYMPDEDVKNMFPQTWASRQANVTHGTTSVEQMETLFENLLNTRRTSLVEEIAKGE